MKRRSFIKGLLGAIAAPAVLKVGDSDVSVLKAKDVPKPPAKSAKLPEYTLTEAELPVHDHGKTAYYASTGDYLNTTGEVCNEHYIGQIARMSAKQMREYNELFWKVLDDRGVE